MWMCRCDIDVQMRWRGGSADVSVSRYFCGTLSLGHSCGTLLWVTLVGSSSGALFWNTPDTTNHPAHQRHAAFTPACFALPSDTAPRKRTFHKAAQIPMALRHHQRRVATRSAQTLEANTSHDTTNHPAQQRHAAFTPACFALPSGTAPRKHNSPPGRTNPHGTATSRT